MHRTEVFFPHSVLKLVADNPQAENRHQHELVFQWQAAAMTGSGCDTNPTLVAGLLTLSPANFLEKAMKKNGQIDRLVVTGRYTGDSNAAPGIFMAPGRTPVPC